MRELILGAGNSKKKYLSKEGDREFINPTTIDIDSRCNPDILWDLNNRPLPFEDEEFDEIHAYEVLEHLGRQGDWRGFFEEFGEYWRILKPGGLFAASVPKWDKIWAWGDPGHIRIINRGTIYFLDQDHYKNIGKTTMTDYRDVWDRDFKTVYVEDVEDNLFFALRKS